MPGWVLEVEGPGGTILSLLAMVEVEGLLLGTRDGERHLSLSLTLTDQPGTGKDTSTRRSERLAF